MKVVFLDFDGVLNSHDFFESSAYDHHSKEAGEIDPEAIARLNRLIEATGAAVVVSSSWRHGRTVLGLFDLLTSRGFRGVVHDKIPDFNRRAESGNLYVPLQRGDEIRGWLDAHPEVTSYVVLDDDADMDAVRERHIKTSMRDGGLLDAHIDQAIAIFEADARDVPR